MLILWATVRYLYIDLVKFFVEDKITHAYRLVYLNFGWKVIMNRRR